MYGGRCISNRVGVDVIDTLIERSELFLYNKKYYYLFAKTGFTDSAKTKADSAKDIILVSFEDF